MILLTFDLCSSVFQIFVAVLVSLREGSFIFFCAVFAGVRVFRVPYATSGYISVSVSLVYMHSGWYLAQ